MVKLAMEHAHQMQSYNQAIVMLCDACKIPAMHANKCAMIKNMMKASKVYHSEC